MEILKVLIDCGADLDVPAQTALAQEGYERSPVALAAGNFCCKLVQTRIRRKEC
jgi:hypothetical protein